MMMVIMIRKKERKKMKSLSHVSLFVTPWTITYQASLSMGFPRQEYWSELPFPSPGDLPDPGIECIFCTAGGFFTTRATWEARNVHRAADDSDLDPALSTRALSLHF